ncbi:unnamed protein product [Cochlearia groenlandica]
MVMPQTKTHGRVHIVRLSHKHRIRKLSEMPKASRNQGYSMVMPQTQTHGRVRCQVHGVRSSHKHKTRKLGEISKASRNQRVMQIRLSGEISNHQVHP